MAVPPKYSPQFPYTGNQIIISSGRVLLHSKDDSIFLFGKKAVGISTTGTFNIDANKGVIIAAPIIELGLTAATNGNQVIRGNDFLIQLDRVLLQLQAVATELAALKSNPEDLASAVVTIGFSAEVLEGIIRSVRASLPSTLSGVTYTI
jgi:hypothetical protein